MKWLRFAAIGAVLTLVSCASLYTPYLADDAGKVRINLVGGGIFSSVAGNIRPVIDGKCGQPMRFQQLFPYVEPQPQTQTRVNQPVEPVRLYPRAGMVGSPDPKRSDAVELQLAPGRHVFFLFGGHAGANCGIASTIDVDRAQAVSRSTFASMAMRRNAS